MVVAPNARRRDHLRFYTAEELLDRDREEYGELFAFTELDPTSVSPQEFFGGAHWLVPTLTTPDSLIDLPV